MQARTPASPTHFHGQERRPGNTDKRKDSQPCNHAWCRAIGMQVLLSAHFSWSALALTYRAFPSGPLLMATKPTRPKALRAAAMALVQVLFLLCADSFFDTSLP